MARPWARAAHVGLPVWAQGWQAASDPRVTWVRFSRPAGRHVAGASRGVKAPARGPAQRRPRLVTVVTYCAHPTHTARALPAVPQGNYVEYPKAPSTDPWTDRRDDGE